MTHRVKIADGQSNVLLPDGGHYNAGDEVDLTDEEFAEISPSALGDEVIDITPTQSGTSVPDDSRISLYNSTPLSTAVELPLTNLAVDVSAGTDITLDANAMTIHLADGHTYLIQASATIVGDTQSTTHLLVGLSMSGAVGFDGGLGVGVIPVAGIGGALQAGGTWWVRSGSGTSFQVLVSPLGAAATVNINGGIDVVRIV